MADAARLLSFVKTRARSEALLAALEDRSRTVRFFAAESLLSLHEPESSLRFASSEQVNDPSRPPRRIQDKDPAERQEAIRYLTAMVASDQEASESD